MSVWCCNIYGYPTTILPQLTFRSLLRDFSLENDEGAGSTTYFLDKKKVVT